MNFYIIYFRNKSQYGYENLSTGTIQWQYPVEEIAQSTEKEDDEMDICTTPPPNVNEVLEETTIMNG